MDTVNFNVDTWKAMVIYWQPSERHWQPADLYKEESILQWLKKKEENIHTAGVFAYIQLHSGITIKLTIIIMLKLLSFSVTIWIAASKHKCSYERCFEGLM